MDSPMNPLPAGLEILRTGDVTTFRRRHGNATRIILVVFTVFWNAVVIAFLGGSLLEGNWMPLAFGSLHALSGIVLAWVSLCLLFNRIDVTVHAKGIEHRHHPFWWPGAKRMDRADAVQLFAKRREVRSKNGVQVIYALCVIDRKDREIVFADHLPDLATAKYLEKVIEERFLIENRPVAGEA